MSNPPESRKAGRQGHLQGPRPADLGGEVVPEPPPRLEMTPERRKLIIEGLEDLLRQGRAEGPDGTLVPIGPRRRDREFADYGLFKRAMVEGCSKLPETRDAIAPSMDENPHMKFLWEIQGMMDVMTKPLRASEDEELRWLTTYHFFGLRKAQMEFMTLHHPLTCAAGCSHPGGPPRHTLDPEDVVDRDPHGHAAIAKFYLNNFLIPLDQDARTMWPLMFVAFENQWQLRHVRAEMMSELTMALKGRAARVIGSRVGLDPEDVAQRVWQGVFSMELFWARVPGQDDDSRPLLRFMWNKVDNHIKDHFRKAAQRTRQPLSEEALASIPDTGPSIEEEFEALERRLASETFPVRARDILLQENMLEYVDDFAAWHEGLSELAAAAKLGKSKSGVHYAREKLGAVLRKKGLEYK